MGRRSIVTLVLYVAALATAPLYDSFGLWLVLAAAAHIGLGLGVGRAWVLVAPAIVAGAWFVAAGAEGLAYLILILGAPAMIGLTAVGWALSKTRLRRGAAIVCAGIVVGVALAGIVAEVRRGPHVPASVQRQLPTNISLGNLCPGASTPKDVERDIRSKAEVLLRELDEHPQHTVTRTAYYSDGGGSEREDITIRQLAQEQLDDLESGGRGCDPELQRRLREGL
jgi:hypothetical protein